MSWFAPARQQKNHHCLLICSTGCATPGMHVYCKVIDKLHAIEPMEALSLQVLACLHCMQRDVRYSTMARTVSARHLLFPKTVSHARLLSNLVQTVNIMLPHDNLLHRTTGVDAAYSISHCEGCTCEVAATRTNIMENSCKIGSCSDQITIDAQALPTWRSVPSLPHLSMPSWLFALSTQITPELLAEASMIYAKFSYLLQPSLVREQERHC